LNSQKDNTKMVKDIDALALISRGYGNIAALCIRDHWEELSEDDRKWCAGIVCEEVERDEDNWDLTVRVQNFSLSADRSSAWVIPILLGKELPNALHERVKQAMALAMTHAVDEVRHWAIYGIRENLWLVDQALATRLLHAIALEAEIINAAFSDQANQHKDVNTIMRNAAHNIRQKLVCDEEITSGAFEALDWSSPFSIQAIYRILIILGVVADTSLAVDTYKKAAAGLTWWWNWKEAQQASGHYAAGSDCYEYTHTKIPDLIAQFLFRTDESRAIEILEPFISSIDKYPDEVKIILTYIVFEEDKLKSGGRFWSFWNAFAENIKAASWLEDIDSGHSPGVGLVYKVLLATDWKEGARHWASLDSYAQKIDNLFMELPPSRTVLRSYISFLYGIGGKSLPGAFIFLSNKLQQAGGLKYFGMDDNMGLEVLLQRHVYGKPLELKQNPSLRESVFYLLDQLVEMGSSAAFKMRDDFLTPLPAN